MRHIPELDGLRAVAVVAVVLFHSAPHGPASGGFIGVDLFFVLSAFLITGILDSGQGLGLFYWRRLIRLMPALLLLLAAYMAFAPLLWPTYTHHGRDAALAALYLSDYSFTFWRAPWFLQHTWSLAVEEHFYLLWPFVLPLVCRSKIPTAWLAAAYVVFTLWRLPFAGDWLAYYYRFDTRLTGLIAGAWLYFARPRIPGWVAAGAAAVLAAIVAIGEIRVAWLFITPAEIAAVALIGYAVQSGSNLLAARPLVGIGKISYGVYLWHFPIVYALRAFHGFTFTAVIGLALSVGAAAISYATVETWAKRLRDNPHFKPTTRGDHVHTRV